MPPPLEPLDELLLLLELDDPLELDELPELDEPPEDEVLPELEPVLPQNALLECSHATSLFAQTPSTHAAVANDDPSLHAQHAALQSA